MNSSVFIELFSIGLHIPSNIMIFFPKFQPKKNKHLSFNSQ